MTDPRLPQNLGAECAAMAQAIEFVAASRLKRARTPEVVEGLVRKVDVLLDAKIAEFQKGRQPMACRPGCDYCCHRVVFASGLEVLDAAAFVERTFGPEQRVSLAQRLKSYVEEVGPKMGHGLESLRPQCPLLVDGMCSVYEIRPLACRSQFSTAVEDCQLSLDNPTGKFHASEVENTLGMAAQNGLAGGANGSGLWAHPVDFARSLHMTLADPSMGEFYLAGHPMFEIAAPVFGHTPPHTPATTPGTTSYRRGEEPTGSADTSVLELPYFYLQTIGDAEAAFISRSGDGPLQQVFRMQAPMAYERSEDIQYWRERMVRAFEELASSRADVREKFDALSAYNPNSLSYQQKNDREFLSKIGDYLTDEISTRVFPDLAEPIPKRRREGKLRVGYIGMGLGQSSGSLWASGWLKNHSDEVESFVFFLSPNKLNGSEQFEQYAHHTYHLPGPVGPAARLIKQQNLDVLIYPDATSVGRDIQFATLRLAPVQCAGWGAPETTGLPNMDFFLSGDWMEPEGADKHYRETLVRLPKTGVCYPRPDRHGSGWSKADFGLDDGLLYLCIQAPSKLLPQWDSLFKEVCDQTGRPIVFFSYPFTAALLTERRLKAAGVDAIFMPCLNANQFYNLLSLADATLDTVGWSGGITTLLAIQQSRPVITLPGEFRRGRHAMAFLKGANAPGLIARDREDYVDLATNPSRQADAVKNLDPDALFDDTESVKALESFLFSVAFN